jgi:hypothetical protein
MYDEESSISTTDGYFYDDPNDKTYIQVDSDDSISLNYSSDYSDYSDDTNDNDNNDGVVIKKSKTFKRINSKSNQKQLLENEFHFVRGRINQPQVFEFKEKIGPTISDLEPIDIFTKFVDSELLDYIVDHSNKYALLPKVIKRRKKKTGALNIETQSSNKNELPINISNDNNLISSKEVTTNGTEKYNNPIQSSEILRFIGLSILMGLNRKNKLNDYWNKNDYVSTPVFQKYFKYKRFIYILSNLNFQQDLDSFIEERIKDDHIENVDENIREKFKLEYNQDVLNKVRWLINYFKFKFRKNYVLSIWVSVDETLVKYKGLLKKPLKKTMVGKKAKTGFKIYKLCESTTGYCYNFIFDSVYNNLLCQEKTTTIVNELISSNESGCYVGSKKNYPQFNLFDKGYIVYVDRAFGSRYLAQRLLKQKTHLVCTCTNNVRFDPELVKNVNCKNKSQKNKPLNSKQSDTSLLLDHGETVFSSCTKNNILALKYNDNICFNMISTIHVDDSLENDLQSKKSGDNRNLVIPKCVRNFRTYMRGVDKQDQYLSYNPIMRKYAKYYKKIFFYLVDMAILNSYIIYNFNTKNKSSFHDFKLKLAKQLLESHTGFCERVDLINRYKDTNNNKSHFIVKNTFMDKKKRLRCAWCKEHNKRSETNLKCEQCNVPLHIDCFKIYHTNNVFK